MKWVCLLTCLLSFTALGTIFAQGSVLAQAPGEGAPQGVSELSDMVSHVEAIIEQRWLGAAAPNNSAAHGELQARLQAGALRGMITALDPHSEYLSPLQWARLQEETRGKFGGMGIEVLSVDGWLEVARVFDGSPAAHAGIKTGDRIVQVEEVWARDLRFTESLELLRGPIGSAVRLRIRRPGQAQVIPVKLVRQEIPIQAVALQWPHPQLPLIRIGPFQDNTADQLRQRLQEIRGREIGQRETRQQGSHPENPPGTAIQAVILDLRSSPGGLLQQAIEVADCFLRSGLILTVEDARGRVQDRYRAHRAGTFPRWPLVVLTNHYTASSAEVLAAALRENNRAWIVGDRTFGKGTVQNVFLLPDGSAVKLTSARYLTPWGLSVQAMGIAPDISPNVARQAGQGSVGEACTDATTRTDPNHRRFPPAVACEQSLPGHIPWSPHASGHRIRRQAIERGSVRSAQLRSIVSRVSENHPQWPSLEYDPYLHMAARVAQAMQVSPDLQ